MQFDTSANAIVNGGSGVLLVLLGLYVLTVRPRRNENVALAAFCLGYGLFRTVDNFLPATGGLAANKDELAVVLLLWAGILAAAAGLGLLGVAAPRVPARAHTVAATLLSGALFLVPMGIVVLRFDERVAEQVAEGATAGSAPFLAAFGAGLSLFFAAATFAIARFTLHHRVSRAPAERATLRLLTASVLLILGINVGTDLLADITDQTTGPIRAVLFVGVSFVLVALWLRNGEACAGREALLARLLAWLLLAIPLLGMVRQVSGGALWLFGAVRVVGFALLVYAILHHQLLGIDLRVKWGIRRGTVAAVFVAVFFVAAEIAQQYLSRSYGLLFGGAVTGLLLFGIQPVQRFAERVADTALPGVKAVGEMTSEDRLRVYREQALAAWADGAITKDERFLLDRLRTTLGIDHADADRIERDAART
ncbi:MAG: hypothetical protein ACT4PT_11705 [Methanobacteriota archaeon]